MSTGDFPESLVENFQLIQSDNKTKRYRLSFQTDINISLQLQLTFPSNYPRLSPVVEFLDPKFYHWPFSESKWIPTRWGSRDLIIKRLQVLLKTEHILSPLSTLFETMLISSRSLKKTLTYLSFGCSNDINQQYPPSIQNEILKHQKLVGPVDIDIILIDPFLLQNEGETHHQSIDFDKSHADVFLFSRALTMEDIDSLERYIRMLSKSTTLYIGDFAVGSPDSSISEYLKTYHPAIWNDNENIKWLAPLSQIGEVYMGGSNINTNDPIREYLQSKLCHVDLYKGEMYLDEFILEEGSFKRRTKFRRDIV